MTEPSVPCLNPLMANNPKPLSLPHLSVVLALTVFFAGFCPAAQEAARRLVTPAPAAARLRSVPVPVIPGLVSKLNDGKPESPASR